LSGRCVSKLPQLLSLFKMPVFNDHYYIEKAVLTDSLLESIDDRYLRRIMREMKVREFIDK